MGTKAFWEEGQVRERGHDCDLGPGEFDISGGKHEVGDLNAPVPEMRLS